MVYSSWVRTMRKKKSNLREYEKNNRVINIPQAQTERRQRLQEQRNRRWNVESFASESAERESGRSTAKKIKINYTKLIVCDVIILLIVYFAMSAIKIVKLGKEKDAAAAYNAELTKDKESLELQLENINSPDYIESQARRDLKLIKPNELLFVFPDTDYSKDEENGENQSQ